MCEKKEFWKDLKSGKFASMVKESAGGQKIANSEEVYNIMKPMFADQDDVESFYCIFLNGKNKILAIEKMFSGSISRTVWGRPLKYWFPPTEKTLMIPNGRPVTPI